uniref:RING-type domain-containing protein n=1 Tax=Malurus cyaneus samueli TaxID=2593467 RepID=A0A8C5THR1_9PASS
MAALIDLERLQRVLELQCSCCLQLFAEPVRLSGCDHSFCRGCILRYCSGRARAACPLCRRAFELRIFVTLLLNLVMLPMRVT